MQNRIMKSRTVAQAAIRGSSVGGTVSTLVVQLAALFVALLVMVIGIGRAQPALAGVTVPNNYLPGQPVPDRTQCIVQRDDYFMDEVGCMDGPLMESHYFVRYDVSLNKILHTSRWMYDDEVRLGDLLVAWGTPTGIGQSFVTWGNRGAFASSSAGLTPFSKVYFVSYQLDSYDEGPWHGFINKHDDPFVPPDLSDLRALLSLP